MDDNIQPGSDSTIDLNTYYENLLGNILQIIADHETRINGLTISTNATTVFPRFDPYKEFPKRFPDEKPNVLAPLRYDKDIMQHRIDPLPNAS